MAPAPRDETVDPERDDRWPRRIAALVATALMLAPFGISGGGSNATVAGFWTAGTIAAVVLGVLAARHGRRRFRFSDVFYVVWATLLALNGALLLLMMYMWRNGWHS